MAADTQEKTELERQLEASGANQHEAEDLHNDALASLEETIQGLEEEKSELQEQADQAETMMAKLRQDIEGLKVANMRASMKVPDGAHHCP
jgi:ABC-type transporter Mla subunit MlaD